MKKFLKLICYFMIFILFNNISVYAAMRDLAQFPNEIQITKEKKSLNEVKYENYTISVTKIKVEGRNEIIYCEEIDKGYPSGQTFVLNGAPETEVDNIISAGYPSKSVEELNLTSADDAYVATQIAIWSALEGYDVNKIKGSNEKIITAIKQIYNDGINQSNKYVTENKEYKSPNDSIQRVVVVFPNTNDSSTNITDTTEDYYEKQQDEYPPQEG